MKVKIKKGEVLNIWNTLGTLLSVKGNEKFINAIAKNRKLVEAEIIAVKSSMETTEPSQEPVENVENEMIELEKYALTDNDEFKRRSKEFRAKKMRRLEEHKRKDEEMNAFLNEEVTIDFQPVKTKDHPKLSKKQKEIVQLFTATR